MPTTQETIPKKPVTFFFEPMRIIELQQLARQLKCSRSEVIRRALEVYLTFFRLQDDDE